MSGPPSTWRRTQIGSVCNVVRGSSPRPIADQRYFDGGTIPWIKIADATRSGRYLYDTREKVNEFGASYSRLLPKGSLIVAASGTLGYTQMLGVPGCIHDGWLHLSSFRGVEKLFLYYWLKCQVQHFTSSAYGAAIQNINTAIMRESVIDLPPLTAQRRIASVLSAYDDLIENNTRRIAILEEMARRIYEEWFVRFRFPGFEAVRMVESELGLVPEGWEIAAVEDVMETLGGGTPSKTEPDYWASGTINWYSPTDLTGAKTVFMEASASKITDLGLAKSSAKLFPSGSIMMTSRATLGVLAVNTTVACTNQGFITCIPSTRMPKWLLFHWLKANASVFEGMATGATFKEIAKGVFRKIELLIPPNATAAKFESVVGPMMDLVLRLERKNRNLRTTRDLLLPKLISGELDVSTLPEPEALAA